MEKRFVAFLLSSFLVLAVYVGIQVMFAPDPPPEAPGDGDVAALDGGVGDGDGAPDKPADGGEKPAEPPKDEPPKDEPPKDGPPKDGPPKDNTLAGGGDENPPAEKPDVPPGAGREPESPEADSHSTMVAIGSMDPADGFRALVTLVTRGAGIRRFELTSREPGKNRLRYHHLEHRHGYLGHLALEDLPEGAGCRVGVVGRGTPAALAELVAGGKSGAAGKLVAAGKPAGIQVGDVIEQINGVAIADSADFEKQILATAPGTQATLDVLRGDSEQPESLKFTLMLTEEPLEMIGPDNSISGDVEIPSLLLSVAAVGKQSWNTESKEPAALRLLREGDWEAKTEDNGSTVEFRLLLTADQLRGSGLEGDWEFVKRYRLARVPAEEVDNPDYPAFHLDCEIEIHNRSETPQELAYRISGPNALPLEGWWYSNKIHPVMFKSAGARDVIWKPAGYRNQQLKGTSQIHAYAIKNPDAPAMPLIDVQNPSPLDYIGVDTQYFASVLLPWRDETAPEAPISLDYRQADALALGNFAEKEKKLIRTTNTSVVLTSAVRKIAPGKPLKQRFVLFAGPKRSELLHAYNLDDVIEFGWFEMVARPLSTVLHFFYYLVGNYGIAIIMLTVLVRGCMFPISRKAARNAQKMQELAPELKKLSDKYKNDMEKRGKAQKELFASHNYNPAGGCLLMFLQLPVFIGLYRCLSVDTELRQASLIPGIEWCSNLAGPDKLWRWDTLMPDWIASEGGWLGPYLNILPIITVSLFMVQQKLFTPPATDEQSRMQQQVMKFMMVFMGVLFFKVPAGLCLYFISSSLWGICERLMLPKSPKPGTTPEPSSKSKTNVRSASTAKSNSNGASRKERAKRRQRKR